MIDSQNSAGRAAVVLLALAAGACTQPPGDTANAADPYERTNRAIHAFNKRLDTNVLKPGSETYVQVVPQPVRDGVLNAANNLQQPLNFVNHVLQGDIEDAASSAFRFGLNTFFGVGGLADPADDAGLYDRPTDFGETLAVWGIDSGPYIELPVFGPSTVRDGVGLVAGFVADPLGWTELRDYSGYFIALEAANALQQRSDYARLIESLLYESADSYNAARIAYLQNRSASLNQGAPAAEDLEDPYAFE
ncbi:VacJ family lipoprotein [Rhodobacteraceae bacterium 2CG4]|uniref:VacJ family lipoprotein n=1 Tax=Halovulum marinum TaxID=2662447 RepID=A0A6L5Z1S6_9RHOB|nr:VacJ family lipoprotein [Halovulum marinum]MSU90497.1 VacJ family lipoprotein [Halovulum marinum]